MLLTDMLDELQLSHDYENVFGGDWEKSVRTMPEKVGFLDKSEYMRCYKMINDDSDLESLLDELARLIKNCPALKALFWHAHCTLVYYENREFDSWPALIPALGVNSGMFYLFTALSAIDIWIETFKAKGFPEKYGPACAAWIGGAIKLYQAGNNGLPGMNKRQLHWIRHYIDGRLFRCGRFEYMNQETPGWCPSVFKRRSDGLTVALCPAGMRLDKAGFCLYSDQEDREAALIATLTQTGSYVEGTPVPPEGTAITDTLVRLPLSEWTQVLGPGDFTPGIHIPAGGGMTLERCRASLEEASGFYKEYFPDKPVKAFICASWIFSPDYERLLPESNMAALMREVYLFPFASSGKDGIFFLFGKEPEDCRDLPRDNSLRRAMLGILDEGKRLRCGGMLFLTNDLDKFGTQAYRREFHIPQELVVKQ